MILMKQLEAKKRSDERERKREDMRMKNERERERRMEQKRLELDVINEMRKPIEDMSLKDHRPLPDLKRLEGIRLSGEAFANSLMIFEFLHNFGETLGFDMDSLPTMDALQAALLFDQEAEEELLSVVIHLVVCAIEDPGIPYPHKHLTILGQNLRQADITNTNVSEILKIYLTARGQVEVKLLHSMTPPEMLHAKDPRRESMISPRKIEEYNEKLRETKGFTYAQWVKDKSFLCLNPTEKSEIIAFICNELLNNKAVVHQIDTNVENVSKAKKDKWEAEAQLKRLKIIQAKKFRSANNSQNSASLIMDEHINEDSEMAVEDKDDVMSVMSESNDTTPSKKRGGKGGNGKKGSKKRKVDPPEEEMDDTNMSEVTSEAIDPNENAEDEKLSPEELQKKIDKSVKKLGKKRDELAFVNNCVRVHELGQDRYRRRYHHFAHAGGVYVEAIESAEPWKLDTSGMPHFDGDDREHVDVRNPKVEPRIVVVEEEEEEEMEIDDREDLEEDIKPQPINGTSDYDKENMIKKENGDDHRKKVETEEALAKLGSDILVTSRMEAKVDVDCKFLPKVTPNGEKLNMFNHSSNLNMTLSPVILNGAVTITPKDPTGMLGLQAAYMRQSGLGVLGEKPWFSILPIGNPVDHQIKNSEFKDMFPPPAYVDTITPQINALEAKLDQLRSLTLDSTRAPIPKKYCHGWWRLSDPEDVTKLDGSLNSRGTREQHLITLVKRNYELLYDAAKRPLPDSMILEPPEGYETMIMEDGTDATKRDGKGDWSKEAALRVDKYILEQVEALEDKVAAASMQVPGWKVPNRPDIDERKFRPACLYNDNDREVDLKDEYGPEATNPVEEARERLLDLEQNIERRYLKAPLGFSNTEISLHTISSRITQ
jgi:hypothetical protein